MSDDGRARRYRWAVGLFLLAALLFLGLAVGARLEELGDLRGRVAGYPWRFSAGWLLAASAASAAATFATGAVWVTLFRAAGGKLAYRGGIAVWLTAHLGRYIPGKVWQFTGLAVHLRRRGGSAAAAVSSSLQAQALVLVTGLAVAATLGGVVADLPGGVAWQALALVVILALFLRPRWIGGLTARLARRLGEGGEAGAAGGRELWRAGAEFTGLWILHGAGFWCYLRGLASPAPTGPVEAVGIFAASYLAGFAVLVAPAGLVAREGAMAALLTALTPLPAAAAAAVAVGARLWVTAGELLAVGAAWVLARGGAAEGPGRLESGTEPSGEGGVPGKGAG